MNIGYTMGQIRGDADLVLFQVAQTLMSRGFRPVGTVQINTERDGTNSCDMDIKVLPDGETLRISQSLGPLARGCRLNPSALEQAVSRVQEELTQGADFLIINKFGKHEAEGRGFRPVIAEALMQEIPVLVGINRLNREAFLKFTGGLGSELPLLQDALEQWLLKTSLAPNCV